MACRSSRQEQREYFSPFSVASLSLSACKLDHDAHLRLYLTLQGNEVQSDEGQQQLSAERSRVRRLNQELENMQKAKTDAAEVPVMGSNIIGSHICSVMNAMQHPKHALVAVMVRSAPSTVCCCFQNSAP